MEPSQPSDFRQRATRFRVCPARFQSCFDPVFSHFVSSLFPYLKKKNCNIYSVLLYVGSMQPAFFILYVVTVTILS